MNAYHPLDVARKEIRVAIIRPSQDHANEVVCELKVVSLLDDPVFEALSYVWGDPKDTRLITLCGQRKQVTVNLDCALRFLRARAPGTPLRLWADAMCINQDDLQERNQQVQIMGEIYGSAVHVRAWLGFPDPLGLRGFVRWQHIVRTQPVDMHQAHGSHLPSTCFHPDASAVVAVEPSEDWSELHKCQAYACQEMIAVAHLFSAAYWRRRWISQELALARSFSLYFGHLKLHMPDMESFARLRLLLRCHGESETPPDDNVRLVRYIAVADACLRASASQLSSLAALQSMVGSGLEGSYSRRLWQTIDQFDASDQRDLIYGLVGFLPKSLGIVVDYTRPYHQCFEDTAVRLMKHFRSFDLLYAARSSHNDLPSWVPNWLQRSRRNVAVNIHSFLGKDLDLGTLTVAVAGLLPRSNTEPIDYNSFDASVDSAFAVEHPADGILRVPGLIVAEISEIVSAYPDMELRWYDGNSAPLHLARYLQACMLACATRYNADFGIVAADPPPAFGRLETYDLYRTLLMDRSLSGDPHERLSPMETARLPQLARDFLMDPRAEAEESGFRNVSLYRRLLDHASRCFFISREGSIGLAPAGARVGDYMCILASASIPLAIRKVRNAPEQHYELLGGG